MNNNYPELGDIILIDFEPQIGVEIAKKRPAVVISRSFFASRTNVVWVCPISSTLKNDPTNVRLDHSTKRRVRLKSARFAL